MKVESKKLSKVIKSNLARWEKILPSRVPSVLNELIVKDLKGNEEIHLFEVLVRLILRADHQPASIIADLMTVIHSDDVAVLEDWTISNCGAFLKDFLQRDNILHLLSPPEGDLQENEDE